MRFFVIGMSLYISSLNSGSNGNCYYIGSERHALLVDAGLTCRETERRLERSGLDISLVRAIFISHEHTDHIRGAEVLSRRHRLPVYITDHTRNGSRLVIDPELARPFSHLSPVTVGDLTVVPFAKRHDAVDPHSFTVELEGTVVGVFTDIGTGCREVVRHFNRCHAAFLESNYDEQMLREGPYPYHLKKRISGGEGHLSNREALQLFLTYRRSDLSHLLLSHLSAENNRPECVADLFAPHAGNTHIVVASRYEETPVYHVCPGGDKNPGVASPAAQMSLF